MPAPPALVFGMGLMVYDVLGRKWAHQHYDAPQLQEFLAEHGPDAAPKSLASDACRRLHCSSSGLRLMSSMNTSSNEGAAGAQVSAGSSR